MNFQTIRKTVGTVLCMEAVFMLPPLLLALADGDTGATKGFAAAIVAVLLLGLPLVLIKRTNLSLGSRDGCVTVALAWIVISVFGAIPFYISGVIASPIDAVFETVSGFSTTGATIIDDVEAAPRAILLWRSITNWVGGMGVLVFMLAILPSGSEGGSMFLLRAEFPGPMAGKLVPRMQKSAKLLYEIYILFTVVQVVLLVIGSVPLFDSVNIALSTVSTGGFAIKNDSLVSYGGYAQTVTLVFMTLCSMSFSIFYCLIAREFLRIKRNHELRVFVGIVLVVALLIGLDSAASFASFGENVRHSLFQVISIISTTCYVSVDAGSWSTFVWALLVLLMITGPMAGSTGGGMKLSRVMILAKSTYRAIAKTITPGSVHLIRIDDEVVDEETVSAVNSFAVAYFIALVLTALILSFDGLDFGKGVVVGISSIGNIGYGLDANTFTYGVSGLSLLSKITLCFDMFLGRLEIFPLLIMFAPATWRK